MPARPLRQVVRRLMLIANVALIGSATVRYRWP
jgi:hypothetical protein